MHGAFQIPGKLRGKTTEIGDFDALTLIWNVRAGVSHQQRSSHLEREELSGFSKPQRSENPWWSSDRTRGEKRTQGEGIGNKTLLEKELLGWR